MFWGSWHVASRDHYGLASGRYSSRSTPSRASIPRTITTPLCAFRSKSALPRDQESERAGKGCRDRAREIGGG
eukprot:813180-Amorphochlora_amoeboformis.AAC.1